MENQIVVNDYRQMDKILKEERTYLLNMCKKIKRAKCNVLLIQKSILRDAVNDLSLHFLSKLNILAIKDIERDEVEFICKVRNVLSSLAWEVQCADIPSRAPDANQLPTSTRSQRTSLDLQILWRKLTRRGLVWSRSLVLRAQG
jgi:chaperonin GroEL (HSP60 family)